MGHFLQRLGQRRVGVHVARHLLGGQVPQLGQGELGQQLGHVRADHVQAEDLAVLGVGDQLDEADRLPQPVRLAVGGERELRRLDVVALVLGLGLGVAEGADLRLAVGRPRDHVVVDRHGLRAGDGLRRDHALRLGGVGQQQLAGAVADRVDVRHVGPHVVVDLDRAAIGQLDPGRLQAVALGPRREADRLHHLVGLERLGLAALGRRHGDLDLVARVVDRLDLGPGQHRDAQLLVLLGQLGGHLRLLQRHHPVQVLHDRDLRAVVRQHVRELDPDRSGAGDDDRLRHGVGHDLLLVGHHPFAQRGARAAAGWSPRRR